MMVKTNGDNTVYDQVVKLTNDYLGPASERFITRQIKTHLDKKPENLTKSDIVKLDEWIRVALALLTDDDKLLENFSSDLKIIAGEAHE